MGDATKTEIRKSRSHCTYHRGGSNVRTPMRGNRPFPTLRLSPKRSPSKRPPRKRSPLPAAHHLKSSLYSARPSRPLSSPLRAPGGSRNNNSPPEGARNHSARAVAHDGGDGGNSCDGGDSEQKNVTWGGVFDGQPQLMDQAFEATTDHEALEMARLDQEILALQYDDDGGGQHDPSFATNSELEHLQKVRNVYGEEGVV